MAQVAAKSLSSTSPTANKMGQTVEVPLNDTIPIIFIPGIMGSNICDLAGNPVWRIGNSALPLGTVWDRMQKNPAVLQKELNPENTRVDTSGTIKVDPRLKLTEKTLRERYWGTVHWASYGGILTFLQLHLNNIALSKPSPPTMNKVIGDAMDMRAERMLYTRKLEQYKKSTEYVDSWLSLLNNQEIQTWHPQQLPFINIVQKDIEHLKAFHFPVYAMGYNWLQSSEIGAAIVAEKLDKKKKEYGSRFHKFIVVTHSMGGLLGRRLVQLRSSDIAGVVHGVMPAEGAPAVYRRLVAGSVEGADVESFATGLVLGKDAEHTTAVLANAPGGLELLPSKNYNYGKPWLFLKGTGYQGERDIILNEVRLPKSDPYEEIYKADKVWWEMVKEELIDPANIIKSKNPGKRIKDVYFKKIEKVKEFHDKIANKYHPHTYVNYGDDSKLIGFGSLTWTLDKPLKGLTPLQIKMLPRVSKTEIDAYNNQVYKDAAYLGQGGSSYIKAAVKENNGLRYIKLTNGKFGTFKISDKNSTGDGTVPWQSGRAPLNKVGVKQTFKMTGFNHQGSYNNDHVQRSVLYSIVKIIKDNNIQPKYR
ncbi:alpha/beta hydrolase [Acinetobacter seifertii]|uniref:esterase/lipase family protein n=1 Tax=Acinetobacter seifertii TaxID=1530123 RepID=UPI00168CB60B|nr:alpha/beta hydrolase [Acinetobacter seifertii]QNX01933.1 alpha/beta hydrolase [Acinetobacter seifertii]